MSVTKGSATVVSAVECYVNTCLEIEIPEGILYSIPTSKVS